MSPIAWDGSLETGDDAVDHQHRAIHQLLNRLESAADDGVEVMRALDYLAEHVLVHFATEEALMEREHFPRALAEAHVLEHRHLTNEVRDRVIAFRSGQLQGVEALADFIRDWLITHVHACDRLLVEHIRARGTLAQLPPAWLDAEKRASA